MTINPSDGVFIADIFGFLLSLLFAPFLTFWVSAVKKRSAVVIGGIIGEVLGFFIIYGWAGPLFTGKDLTNVQPAAVFFGSLLFCTALGVVCGMIVDLLVARSSEHDYRRPAHE
jgi:Kef-type K+ transport system membrane component KefB